MPFFDEVLRQIKIFLRLNLAPEIAHKIITVYMEEIRQNAGRLSTAGVVLLFGTAMALMLTIDRSINAIWRVQRSRRWWVSMVSYVLLLVMGPLLLVVSVSITTYFMVHLSPEGTRAPWRLHGFVPQLAPMAASAAAFFLMYVFVPHRRVPWKHALVGGVAAAVLFELAKEGFARYVSYAPTVSIVYGTFAALPLFLLWLYLSWLVVLLGAELAASLDYWVTGLWKRDDAAAVQVGDAISVARRLFGARGKALSFAELQRGTGLPAEHLEQALIHLTADGLAKEVARGEYAIPEGPSEEGPDARRPVRKGKRRRGRSARSSP
jgi:membrane protein